LKLGGYLLAVGLSAVIIWFAWNPGGPFGLEAFDVFYTIEGIGYSLAGVAVFVVVQKVVTRG